MHGSAQKDRYRGLDIEGETEVSAQSTRSARTEGPDSGHRPAFGPSSRNSKQQPQATSPTTDETPKGCDERLFFGYENRIAPGSSQWPEPSHHPPANDNPSVSEWVAAENCQSRQ